MQLRVETNLGVVMTAILCGSCAVILTVSAFAQASGRKPNLKNSVLIKGATFQMGLERSAIPHLQSKFKIARAELFEEQTPGHQVKLNSFYIDKTEAVNADFQKFIRSNPEWRKDKIAAEYHNGKYLQQWNGDKYPAGQANFPVVFVTWHSAVAYCQSQGKRLPTEAEWEYAARGGLIGKTFPWGDEMPDKARVNYGESGFNAAIAVRSYPANGYGLFDMAGNVWEYIADEWQTYPIDGAAQLDPVAGGDLFVGESYRSVKTRRVLRGGSYGAGPVNLLITYRDSHLPTNAGDHVGFRCAATGRREMK